MIHIFGVLFIISCFDTRSFAQEDRFCPIINLPNGKYEVLGQSHTMGAPIPNYALVKMSCNSQYALYPSNSLVTCLDGNWNIPLPECRKTCSPRISNSVNVTCTVDGNIVDCNRPVVEGTLARSTCKHFYTKLHPEIPISRCSGGSWDYPLIRCVPECGEELLHDIGQSTKISPFPWHVGLYRLVDGKHKYYCGGSIISPLIILSAAHCLTDPEGVKIPAQEFYVAAGKFYSDYNATEDNYVQKRQVKEFHVPPQYRGYYTNFAGDLAVVVLVNAFVMSNGVRPVCIEWDNKIENEQLTRNNRGSIIGWGNASKDSAELRLVTSPYIDISQCLDDVPNNFRRWVTVDKFCAGLTNGTGVCKGDSGGGLVFEWDVNNRSKLYIRGVLSIGSTNGECDRYQHGLYTKISAYYDFILNIISSNTDLRTGNCPELKTIDHGKFEILGQNYKPGSPVLNYAVIKFSCNTYYALRPANPLVTCLDGNFTNPIPQCKREVIKNVIDECGNWNENSPAPWNVAIYHKENSYKFRCGGSIITATVIITAAQCMTDKNEYELQLPAEEFYVAAGKYNSDYNAEEDKLTQKSQVKEYHIPPEFNGVLSDYKGDIAVVVLKNSFHMTNVVQPVCLDRNNIIEPRQVPPNSNGIVVAWIRDYRNFDPEVKQSNTTYVDKEQCLDILSSARHNLLTSDKFCARYIRCGNYGGGMAYKWSTNNKQQFYTQGVNSFVDNKGVCNDSNTGIFTNIAFHKEFILNIIDEHLRTDSCPNVTIENGQFSVFDSIPSYTLAIQFRCNDNYTLHPKNPLVACSDGDWTVPIPQCKLTCPPIISNTVDVTCTLDGNLVNCSQPLVAGTDVISKCKPYYTQSGHDVPITTCTTKGFWSNPLIRCIPDCGELISNGVTNIVNGTSSKKGEFPWHIAIYRLEEEEHKYKCGGSIINPLIIITAAHCFTDERAVRYPADEFYVGAGKYYSDYNSLEDLFAQKRRVKEYYIPVEYKAYDSNFAGDLAVVVVRKAFQMSSVVQPVCVDWQSTIEKHQLKPNNTGSVVGWGYVDPNVRRESAELKQLNPPYIDRNQCYDAVPSNFKRWITVDKFCAGFINGTSICQGDSGGGLVFKWNQNEKYFIHGLVSVGPIRKGVCDNFQYGVYTKISFYMHNFILNIINANPITN